MNKYNTPPVSDRLVNWQISSISDDMRPIADEYSDSIQSGLESLFNYIDEILRKYSIDRTEDELLLLDSLCTPNLLSEGLYVNDDDSPRVWLFKVLNISQAAYCIRNNKACTVFLKLVDSFKS